MTSTEQNRCVPATETTGMPPLQGEKYCKTDLEEMLDDMNALCESLSILDTRLRRLNYLADKKLEEQNKRKNAEL